MADVNFSTVVFRHRPKGMKGPELDAHNARSPGAPETRGGKCICRTPGSAAVTRFALRSVISTPRKVMLTGRSTSLRPPRGASGSQNCAAGTNNAARYINRDLNHKFPPTNQQVRGSLMKALVNTITAALSLGLIAGRRSPPRRRAIRPPTPRAISPRRSSH